MEAALQETGARDPRAHYRSVLKQLRERSADAYEAAVRDYRETVIEAIAEERADPLGAWLEYGLRLAERLHPGRTVEVDESGRAAPFAPPPSWRSLILHLPDDPRQRALSVSLPPEPSGAQRATVDLLVQGSLKLPGA